MNRYKSSHSGLSGQNNPPNEVSSPVAPASQDVTWKYCDSPVRRNKVTKASELFTTTPVRIIKRHASSPLPDGSSSKALLHSRKLKTLVEFEQLDDDDSFNFSADFDITEDELTRVIEEADKKVKHDRLETLTSPAMPQPARPLRPKRQINDEVPVPLYTKRMSESDLPRTQLEATQSKEPATSKDDTLDLDNSYDNALLSSIPLELLSSQTQSTRVEIRFDPKLNLSQIVTQSSATSSTSSIPKTTQSIGEKKFFKHRSNPVPQTQTSNSGPLNLTQKLQIAENRRQALKRLEETKKRQQSKLNKP